MCDVPYEYTKAAVVSHAPQIIDCIVATTTISFLETHHQPLFPICWRTPQRTRSPKNGSQPLPVSEPYCQFLGIDELYENPLSDGAGVDTTLAVITRFVMSMILYPEIQRRAQEEIDRVTGGHRLPTLEECVLTFGFQHHATYLTKTRNTRRVPHVVNRLNYHCSKASLPYIDALIKELHRWNIIIPFAIPHRLIRDDEYRGTL